MDRSTIPQQIKEELKKKKYKFINVINASMFQ